MTGENIILVTGAAGFIGSNLVCKLLQNISNTVVCIDCMSPYYDKKLKYSNIERIKKIGENRVVFYFYDIRDESSIDKIFKEWKFNKVYHLAAQAGVRYSIDHTKEVIETNVIGFNNILEHSIANGVKHFVYASSSSVYGDIPDECVCEETNECFSQKSPYAVTKRCNELMAEMYASKQTTTKLTGLRFFTVYGPYMRPDLAIGKFTKAVLDNNKIEIYGDGNKQRDFTYIDDIVDIMITIMDSDKFWKHEIFNIGYGSSISVNNLVKTIKDNINPNFDNIEYSSDLSYDVNKTLASIEKLKSWFDIQPKVKISDGLVKYINWYKQQREV